MARANFQLTLNRVRDTQRHVDFFDFAVSAIILVFVPTPHAPHVFVFVECEG
jgi:hypothetical protein